MSQERIGPISPKDVEKEKIINFPSEVFEAFNELIIENSGSGEIYVGQKEVVARMIQKGLSKDEIYKKGWLDVEDVYRKAGWKVDYDKPGYNEDYEPYFKFSRKRARGNN